LLAIIAYKGRGISMEALVFVFVFVIFLLVWIFKDWFVRGGRTSAIEVNYSPEPATKFFKSKDGALAFAGRVIQKGGQVHFIDANEVAGVCEGCGKAILEDEPYNYDTEGVVWHMPDCSKSFIL